MTQQKVVGIPFRSRKSAALNAGWRLGEAPDEEKVARRAASQRRKGIPTAFCEQRSFLINDQPSTNAPLPILLNWIECAEQCRLAVFGFTGVAELRDRFE